MVEKGKIVVSGFKLDRAEKAIINNLIRSWKEKIERRIKFKEIKINIKKVKKGKNFMHEISGNMLCEGLKKKKFNTKVSDYNLFSAIAEVFEKLLNEALHKKK